MLWRRNRVSFLAIPSIYATESADTLAPGCRAIESFRLLWSLANQPESIRDARERVKASLLLSDEFRTTLSQASSTGRGQGYVTAHVLPPNPMDIAARTYIQNHGLPAFSDTVLAVIDRMLA